MKLSESPHLIFYLKNQREIPMKAISREEYDELNSYEPMMYRPENWERFNKHQYLYLDYYTHELETKGYIPQVQKIAVMNHEDFLSKKDRIESEEGFVEWFN